MNFPEIVDLALPAEGVFHNLVFVSIRKTYPMQAHTIMQGLWGTGQTRLRRGFGRQVMFTKYIIVVDDDVNVHNTSEVRFRLCANTDPQRDSFTKGPTDVLDHATSEIALPREIEHSRGPLRITRDYLTGRGRKLGLDATRKLPSEGFKRPWPPLIKMDAAVKAKVGKLFGGVP
jgi:4-hydroxy-3-polyprenylbenzoate decarboxylase